MAIRCGNCGGEIQGRYDFCPTCGYNLTGRMRPVHLQLQKRRGMSTTTIVILLVALVVVIPTALAAVLYVMTSEDGTVEPPYMSLTVTQIAGGVKMTLSEGLNIDTIWSDVTILLSDGVTTDMWTPWAEDLDGRTAVTAAYGSRTVGVPVFLNIMDIAGNGYLNAGDYFTLTGSLLATTTYTATLVFDPTASEICHQTFTG